MDFTASLEYPVLAPVPLESRHTLAQGDSKIGYGRLLLVSCTDIATIGALCE